MMMLNKLLITIFNAQSVRNKKNEIFEFLSDNQVDIALLSETHLTDKDSFSCPDYITYRLDRLNHHKGGGVALMIKRGIKHDLLPCPDTQIIEALSIQLYIQNHSLEISSIYFPPSKSNEDHVQFAKDLQILTKGPNFLIGGDFNARHTSWNCIRNNTAGHILYKIIQNDDLMVHYPDTPTHFPHSGANPSTIDLMITKGVSGIDLIGTDDSFSSDHVPILFALDFDVDRSAIPARVVKDFSKANWLGFTTFIDREIPQLITALDKMPVENHDIDSSLEKFTQIVEDADRHFIPTKTLNHNGQPSLPNDILALIGLRRSKNRSYRRQRDPILRQEIKTLTIRIDYRMREVTNERFDRSLKLIDKHPGPFRKKFWRITKYFKNRSRPIPILKTDGKKLITELEKCNALANHFAKIHEETDTNLGFDVTSRKIKDSIAQVRNISTNIDTIPLVRKENILPIVKSLNLSKTPGLDKVSNKHLRNLPLSGLDFLSKIFNCCLRNGYFPDDWKKSKIFCLCKPGKPSSEVSSYRPISLLSNISKVFERIILQKLNAFIDERNIILSEQYGFRKGKSCNHQLFRITNYINGNLKRKKSTGMLSVDLKAAFDSVWHEALLHKMVALEFPLYLVKMVESFLSNRRFVVSMGQTNSSEKTVDVGVPQGAVLSPTLFNIFLSDIPRKTSEILLALFADDTAGMATSHSTKAIINKLQRFSDSLCRYFRTWRIRVNALKSEAMIFTRKRAIRHRPQKCVKVNGVDVNWNNSATYLGMKLDPKLTYRNHVESRIIKSDKAFKALYPLINRKSKISTGNKLLLYKSIFRPTLTYASPIWHNCAKVHQNRLQRHQNKILKVMLNLPRLTPTESVHELAGIDQLKVFTEKTRLAFVKSCQYNINQDINDLLN